MTVSRHVASLALLLLGLASCGDPEPPPATAPAAPQAAPKTVLRETTVASFERSPLTYAQGQEPAQPAAPLPTNDPAADAGLAVLMHKAVPQAAKADALNLIEEARAFPSAKLCDLVQRLLRHPDSEVRAAALTLLEGHDAHGILQVVESALADKEAAIRLQGVEVLKHLTTNAAKPLYRSAMQDTNPNVRMLAFTSALEVSDAFREEVITTGSTSPYEDVAASSLSFMEAGLVKAYIPHLIQALDHPSSAVRRQAYERLFLTLDEKFSTANQARAWWQKNQHRFDDDLVMIEAPLAVPPPR